MYKNACYIAKHELETQPNLDYLVIQLAALFHDLVDFKYELHSSEPSRSLEQLARERLEPFFAKYKHKLTASQIENIIFIILNISFRKELEANALVKQLDELKIVRDADRLDAIGAVGIARCFGFSGAKKRPFYIEGVEPILNITAEQYNAQTVKNESTAINHFYEKLLLLKEKISTETAKRMAHDRHEFMLAYLRQFENECKIDL